MAHLVGGLTLKEIGLGAGHAVWGFRAAVISHLDCPTLINGFENILSDYGRPAIDSLSVLAHALGNFGSRKLGVACPGCGVVTADELSIVALLSAAQREDDFLADAHLAWLMGGRSQDHAKDAAFRVGAIFQAGQVEIEAPPIEISTPTRAYTGLTLHTAGHA
ncbi:MAG: hypothetical protein AAF668_11295 [Pseudomonadota bacterium]